MIFVGPLHLHYAKRLIMIVHKNVLSKPFYVVHVGPTNEFIVVMEMSHLLVPGVDTSMTTNVIFVGNAQMYEKFKTIT